MIRIRRARHRLRRGPRTVVAAVLSTVLLCAGGLFAWNTTAGAATAPAVWVGSPLSATWGVGDGLPANHHIAYRGDWSVDLRNVATGAPVVLYAAPQDGRTPISARVDAVGPSCANGVLADGGRRVEVGLYTGATRIGKVVYAHVEPRVAQGSTINRWGTTVGTVGAYRPSSCWQGVHLHVEMESAKNYACYNRGWRPDQRMNPTNFIGFTGGNFASRIRQACP